MQATEIAADVRGGRRTAAAVVADSVARIRRDDPAVGAFQAVADQAAADQADRVAQRPDLPTLPLAGVPVAIKDNVAVAGLPTRHGSAASDARPADADDELVTRLRTAGAVVVGSTRLPELAIWPFTESRAFGGTRNPRDPSRNAGGSTGGAAAVAAGMVPLALGSDGGGSLRIPAANCGVVGLKPGRGTVPLAAGLTEHWYGCTEFGPVAATVADAALMLDVLAGVDRWRQPRPPQGPLRVAVSLRSPSPFGRADAVARAAVGSAVAGLRATGHHVVTAAPPYPTLLINTWVEHWLAGVAVDAARLGLAVERLEPRTRAVLRKGERLRRRGRPGRDAGPTWRNRVLDWFGHYDVLVTPVIAHPAPAAGWARDRGYLRSYLHGAHAVPYTQAWNLAGLPALSLPVGGTPERPGAVQIVAPTEELVLRTAHQLEQLQPARSAAAQVATPA